VTARRGSRGSGYARISTLRNNCRRRHLRASTPEWKIEDSSFKLAMALWFSATVRLTREDSGWVWVGGVGSGVMRPSDRARKCWERIEERWPSSEERAILIDI